MVQKFWAGMAIFITIFWKLFLVQTLFDRVFRQLPTWIEAFGLERPKEVGTQVDANLSETLEFVVDETLPAFRALGNYRQRLGPALMTSLIHLDALVDAVPEAFVCSRSTYLADPRVSAFFVNPTHLGEVFSASDQVRALFHERPDIQESWGLLCMRHERQQRFGVDLVNDRLLKDVQQEVVNFTDHEFLAPGIGPTDARQGLKCCMLKGLLTHAKAQLAPATASGIKTAVPMTLNRRFDRLLEILTSPEDFVRLKQNRIWLDRMGVVRTPESQIPGVLELELSEIEIATKGRRIGALVGFPREELLPKKDFRHNAERFLAI